MRLTFTLILTLLFTAFSPSVQAQQKLREKKSAFFKTEEARQIGDQVILWQRVTGGWPKNHDKEMEAPMTEAQREAVLKDKSRRDDSTTDNRATSTQMNYLARLYQATGDVRYRDAFRLGVQYLLSGQYDNGGWPQFWPENRDYQIHITYNDDAMVSTMLMLRDMFEGKKPYEGDLCDPALKKAMKKSFDKGVECILNTQIKTDGKLTIWCQQHDRETFLPAPARAYELPSYSTQESAAIVRLLMELPNPDKRVKAAVHGAMAWFDKYKLSGLRLEKTESADGKKDTRLLPDSTAGALWSRYYDLDHTLPYVCDRDGIPRRSLTDIGPERRNGYSWYNKYPADLYPMYETWAAKFDPKHKVALDLNAKGANENGILRLGVQPKANPADFNVVVNRGESIQQAIEQAPENGKEPFKILVRKGLYKQQVIIDRPNIVLVGEQRDSCIIVGASLHDAMPESDYRGKKVHSGIVVLTDEADDCLISGLTVINNYGTTVTNTTSHQFSVYGTATRTIVINCNIISDGNDALSLWAQKDGMYYHSDLFLRCPGVDFLCPRGLCYATRCRFLGDTRAILWHDGRGNKNNKLVVTNSEFDALKPTPLGRYHHDSQFYLINCELSERIIDADIDHAYRAQPSLAKGKTIDPCPWGHRVYYYGCIREGGHSGWLNNNLDQADGKPDYKAITAKWTFKSKWDPEKRIRDLWNVVAY